MLARKGVSPLVATALLIAIAISAALIVSSWLIPFVRDTTKDIEKKNDIDCSYASVYVREIRYDCALQKAYLLVENNGDIKLNGFKVNVLYGNASSATYSVGSSLEPGVRTTMATKIEGGDFTQMVFFPIECPSRGDTISASNLIKESC